MIEFIAHNLAPIMFVTVMGFLVLGYPVALTLAAGGIFFFVVGVGLSDYSNEINLFWPLLRAMPERVFGIMSNDTLLAIPFFTFMGLILERSRMAEDLLDTIGQLFGPVRGGLAFAVVIVGALLAATTGVVAASVIAMGLISLPIMQRYAYDEKVATGTIVAAGTLAQIVPPSLVLIVMADQLGVSVGDMYLGAIYPALIIIAIYCLYLGAIAILKPSAMPPLPPEERRLGTGLTSLAAVFALAAILYFASSAFLFAHHDSSVRVVFASTFAVVVCLTLALVNRRLKLGILSHLAEEVVIVLIPPLALIFLVLGTIFLGIATPTEGGAMGAVGALALATVKRRMDFKTLKSAVLATANLSAFVLFILIGARVFGLTFFGVNGQVWLEELLLALPGGEYGFLIAVTIVIFILGCFLDFFEIAFILVPLLAPVAQTLGIDLIWFGVILSINLQTSFLTPPFGFSLFYLRSVAPNAKWTDKVTGRTMQPVRTVQIYRGVIPYIAIQFAMILLVIFVPGLVTHYDDSRALPPPSVSGPAGGAGGGSGGLNFGTPGGSGGAATQGSERPSGNAGFNFGGSGGGASPPSGASGGLNFGNQNGSNGSAPAAEPAAPANPNSGGLNFGGGTESETPAEPAGPQGAGDQGLNFGAGGGSDASSPVPQSPQTNSPLGEEATPRPGDGTNDTGNSDAGGFNFGN